MKRSEALTLIANQLDFLSGKFKGYRKDFSTFELAHANVILTTLEEAGMLPPELTDVKYFNDPYKWEPEEKERE